MEEVSEVSTVQFFLSGTLILSLKDERKVENLDKAA